MTSLESVIVQIADAISSSRPGARRENVETYIKRLQNLERIADSFEGVEKSYAIQAGREVRIVVQPEKVDDLSALAHGTRCGPAHSGRNDVSRRNQSHRHPRNARGGLCEIELRNSRFKVEISTHLYTS